MLSDWCRIGEQATANLQLSKSTLICPCLLLHCLTRFDRQARTFHFNVNRLSCPGMNNRPAIEREKKHLSHIWRETALDSHCSMMEWAAPLFSRRQFLLRFVDCAERGIVCLLLMQVNWMRDAPLLIDNCLLWNELICPCRRRRRRRLSSRWVEDGLSTIIEWRHRLAHIFFVDCALRTASLQPRLHSGRKLKRVHSDKARQLVPIGRLSKKVECHRHDSSLASGENDLVQRAMTYLQWWCLWKRHVALNEILSSLLVMKS